MTYDPSDDARKSYAVAIDAMREELEACEKVQIQDATLYRGDCLTILPTLGKMDCVMMDPPYSELVHSTRGRRGNELRKDGGPEIETIKFDSIDQIQFSIAQEVCRLSSGWFLTFSDIWALPRWRESVLQAGGKSKSICLWLKPDCAPQFNGQKPALAFECIGVFWCGEGYSKWNAGGKRGVYQHFTNPPDRHGIHPTEKPWRLIADLLIDFTQPGQSILDPFMGSGSIGVACAKLRRRFIGIELNPEYFEIACRRIEQAYAQPDLFIERPAEPKQEAML